MNYLLALFAAVETNTPPDMSWLGPTVSAIGGVLVAMVGGISLAWRRGQERKDSQADKVTDAEIAAQPKVTDGWEEVRLARLEASKYYNLYRVFENMFYVVSSALKHLARSTRVAHPDHQFDKVVVDALAVVPPEHD